MKSTLIHRASVMLVAALLCISQPGNALAAPGDLDLTFDPDGIGGAPGGIFITPIGSSDESALGVAIQSDGKIVVAGNAFIGNFHDFAVARYTANGVLDTTFGGTGKVTTPIGSDRDFGQSVVIQNDGKVLVAGYAYNPGSTSNDFALVRYTPAGALDPSFGGGTGKVLTHVGPFMDEGYSVALQSDGKILVAGLALTSFSAADFAVARYTSAGELDLTFGGGTGKVLVPFAATIFQSNPDDRGYSLAIQSDGKIVVAGMTSANGGYDSAVIRLTAAGDLDPAFGSGSGKVITPIGNGDDRAFDVAVQDDGKIVVAGTARNGATSDFMVARYTSAGVLDTTFGGGTGKLLTPIGNFDDTGRSLAILADGKIVVAGTSSTNGSQNAIAVVRYTPSGALDVTFGGGTGKVVAAHGNSNTLGNAAAIQSDGKIVVAGAAHNGSNFDFAVGRFEGGSPLPPSATLLPVADLCLTGATLAGTVNPNGSETTVVFETRVLPGGTFSPAGAQVAAQSPIPEGDTAVEVSATLARGRLLPATQYGWRIMATNVGGTTLSQEGTFTTPANVPPVADPGGPYSVRADGTLSLDAGRSMDPDAGCGDSIVSYEWDFNLDGTCDETGETVELTAAMRQDFGQVQPTRHTSRLRVTDTFGATHTVDFDVTVLAIDPQFIVELSKGGEVPGAGVTGSGIPEGAQWDTFGIPAVNAGGKVAVIGGYRSASGKGKKIFVGNLSFSATSEMRATAGVGEAAFGAPAGVLFNGFKDPLLNERGDVAFLANLAGTGVTSANNQALFVVSTDNDSDRLVARKGAEPAGVPGAQLKAFSSVAFANETTEGGAWTVAFTATMVTGPKGTAGPGGVVKADDTGLWLADATRLLLAVREGQTLTINGTARVVKTFYALKPPTGAVGHGFGVTAGGLPVKVVFVDGTQAMLRVSLGDVDGDGIASLVVGASGEPISGIDATLKHLGLPTQDGSGTVSVWVSSLNTRFNPSAVVSSDGRADLVVVARKGDALSTAPDSLAFESLTSAAANAEGAHVILGKLRGGVVTKGADVGIARRLSGAEWEVIARKGTQPPGVPDGAKFASFPSYALADDGTLAFLGMLVKPRTGELNPANITGINDTGLWVAIPGEPLQLLLREGDTLGEGSNAKAVRSFAALAAISGSASQRRTFSADGSDLLIRVIATDGSQHLLHIIIPPPPPRPRL